MGIKVRFQGGPRAGQVQEFGDDVACIAIGRDAETCQVVFPADQTRVGSHHCTLEKVAGRYRLMINRSNPVMINGQRVENSTELTSNVDLQLGRDGPILKVEPQKSSALPPTDDASLLDGTGTRLTKLKKSSGRMRRVIVALLLLVLATIGVGYRVKQHFDAQLTALSDAQVKLVGKLADQYAIVNTRIDELKPKFQDIADRVAPSVYLVIKDDGRGNLDAQATAWVYNAEQQILATNAHVAAMFEALVGDEKLIVRSSGPKVADFKVTKVKVHPGYAQFREIWSDYDPVVVASTVEAREVRSAGQACDVGLLYVEPVGNSAEKSADKSADKEAKEAGKLGPALTVADGGVFPQLKRGYPICFVGYPMEGLVLDGVTLAMPDQTMHTAYVVSTTDYFGISAEDIGQRHLVKHALPLAGGASGSPIVNEQGQVVAVVSGGNMIGSTGEARISSGADINFGQRVDLLAEILDGTAESRQHDRHATWEKQIHDLYAKRSIEAPKAQLAKALEWQRDGWQRDLAAYGANQVKIIPVESFDGPLATEIKGGSKIFRHRFNVPAGNYLLSAATESNIALTLQVDAARGDKPIGSTQAEENVVDPQFGTEPKWSRGVPISLKGPASVEARALSNSDAPHVLLQLDRAEVKALSKEDRLAAIVNDWNRIVDDSSSTSKNPTIVAKKAGVLQNTKDAVVGVIGDTLEPGRYLAVAIPSSDVDINLWMGRASDHSPLVDDRGPGHWAHGSFTLADKASIEALVFGPSPQVSTELILYRAE